MPSLPEFLIVDWRDGAVVVLDQRRLPTEETYLMLKTVPEVAEAIRTLTVRGAPAIGVAGAFGLALGVRNSRAKDFTALRREALEVAATLRATRPTAVNLAWGLDRLLAKLDTLSGHEVPFIQDALLAEAKAVKNEDVAGNRQIGRWGREFLQDGDTVLTHCNAGALATAGYGTALGVVYAAVEQGKRIQVFADETRPLWQGARLTAWELKKSGVPVTVITDGMAASFMQRGHINKVIVGADRIAANGDAANKIGTLSVALAARYFNIPFYVAAPYSTIDLKTPNGASIPIEERSPDEIRHPLGLTTSIPLVPPGVAIKNPAFDVTPHHLISAIITEKGAILPPFSEGLAKTLATPAH